ncbi:flagellar export chaperone FliS [Azotobacter bryophylli]|uniref:Flagellar secretion chaperone FliS n=1 Tax=Azotobacter bryophylli TaxID=1986537 RepID=A0ABV7ATE2_9GAMM
MSGMRGANAYAKVGVESGVLSASPHQLIVMLFDAAQTSIRAARLHMQAGNVTEKGKAISRAIDIVNRGLLAALDHERGGELAGRLEQIYNYVTRLLLQANLRNDQQSLDQAANLLEEIGSAWREIAPQVGESRP